MLADGSRATAHHGTEEPARVLGAPGTHELRERGGKVGTHLRTGRSMAAARAGCGSAPAHSPPSENGRARGNGESASGDAKGARGAGPAQRPLAGAEGPR